MAYASGWVNETEIIFLELMAFINRMLNLMWTANIVSNTHMCEFDAAFFELVLHNPKYSLKVINCE